MAANKIETPAPSPPTYLDALFNALPVNDFVQSPECDGNPIKSSNLEPQFMAYLGEINCRSRKASTVGKSKTPNLANVTKRLVKTCIESSSNPEPTPTTPMVTDFKFCPTCSTRGSPYLPLTLVHSKTPHFLEEAANISALASTVKSWIFASGRAPGKRWLSQPADWAALGTTQAEGCRLITAAYRLHEMEQVMDEVRSDCKTLAGRHLPRVVSTAEGFLKLFRGLDEIESNGRGVLRAVLHTREDLGRFPQPLQSAVAKAWVDMKACSEQLGSESREAANELRVLKKKVAWLRKMASVSAVELAAVTQGGGSWPGCRTCAEHVARVLHNMGSSPALEGVEATLDQMITVLRDPWEYGWAKLLCEYDDYCVNAGLRRDMGMTQYRANKVLESMSHLSRWSEVITNVEHAHRILQRQWDT